MKVLSKRLFDAIACDSFSRVPRRCTTFRVCEMRFGIYSREHDNSSRTSSNGDVLPREGVLIRGIIGKKRATRVKTKSECLKKKKTSLRVITLARRKLLMYLSEQNRRRSLGDVSVTRRAA